jgi:hypothetical protein
MNIEGRIQSLENKIILSLSDLKSLKKEYKKCRDFTAIFLNLCKKYKIKKVAIGIKTDKIESSKSYPWGGCDSIFTEEKKDKDSNFPALWSVIEELNPEIHMSCGNGYQAQIGSEGMVKLIEGYYEYKNGKFYKKKINDFPS